MSGCIIAYLNWCAFSILFPSPVGLEVAMYISPTDTYLIVIVSVNTYKVQF